MRPFRPTESGKLGLFAASSPFPEARYQAGRRLLEQAGFEIEEAVGLNEVRGYLAGPDEARSQGLLKLLLDPTVSGLWAVRGGYGLTRILPELEKAPWAEQEKPVLGFSDLTALHSLLAHLGLQSIHAPVLTQLGALAPEAATSCFRLLAGKSVAPYAGLGPGLVPGRAKGRLLGGNLSVLISLLGTRYFPPLDGALLLLEDVGEATYRIDRMLTQLLQSGMLSGIRGIALGEFNGCHPRNEAEPDVLCVLAERLGALGVPVLAGLPFGHGDRNLPVVLGREHELDADAMTLAPLDQTARGSDRT